MTRLGEAILNIRIAIRLGMFDGNAAAGFQDDDRTFWRSFWAVPPMLALTVIGTDLILPTPVEGARRSPTAIGWLGISVLAALLIAAEFARVVNRLDAWPRFVVAQNWASLIQGGMLAAAPAMLLLVGAPSSFLQLAMVAIGFWALAFDWYVAKKALNLTGIQAALLTGILLAAKLVIGNVGANLSAG